ncbi:MAG: hypothetical protein WCH46_08020 [bacterium]
MKLFVTFLLVLVLASSGIAQISFSSADFLAAYGQVGVPSTQFTSTVLTGLDALIGITGAGVSWDIGNRTFTQDGTPASTSTLLTYPGGAALANDPDFTASTHVFKSVPSDPTQPTTYLFIKFTDVGYWWLGTSQDSMGTKSKVFGYAPPQYKAKFPLTYQTSWQSSSTVHSDLFPAGSTYTVAIDAIVDGYGTLLTPTSTHLKNGTPVPTATSDAIRVKTKNTSTISFVIGPINYSSTTVNYSFEYFTKSGHSATISADTNVKATGITYSTQGGSAVDQYLSPENLLNLYLSSNPASNIETKLSFNMKKAGNAQVDIMDALGHNVQVLHKGNAEVGQNIIPIDPTKLSCGTYFIRVAIDG